MRLPAGPLPRISVVMPTHGRKVSLLRALRALALQVYPGHLVEVVLVCDGNDDGSAEAARGVALPFRLTVLTQENAGPAVARNLALAHARGPLVVFLDDDVMAHPYLLAEHAAAHGDRDDVVVIGPLIPPPDSPSPWVRWELKTVVRQYDEMEGGAYRPGPRQFFTGNASVRLEHLHEVGGFDPTFRRGEDVELAFRLQSRGLHFVFHRGAAALHTADRSLQSWLRAAFEYGRNDVILGQAKGRPDMLEAVAREFHERHPLTQSLVRRTRSSPRLRRALARSLGELSRPALALGRERLAVRLCSAAFAVSYWSGVAAQLGGPAGAAALIERGRPAAKAASTS
ncbi:MAG TPA: glycosyltransferase [Candidatus Limnocylindrales bacterium]|nr:glycosyltransferase [Candidatus Limnocylindrales bacterium]